jgi:hypothetical protein
MKCTEVSGLEWVPVAGSCKSSNEHVGVHSLCGISSQPEGTFGFQEGLSSMQLVHQSSIRISNMITYLLVQQLMEYCSAALVLFCIESRYETPWTGINDCETSQSDWRPRIVSLYFRVETRGCEHSKSSGTLHRVSGSYRCFGEAYILHLQDEAELLCVTSFASPTS